MTDEQLTAYLCLTPKEAAIVIPRLSPQQRATYERMASLEALAEYYRKGLKSIVDFVNPMTRAVVRESCAEILANAPVAQPASSSGLEKHIIIAAAPAVRRPVWLRREGDHAVVLIQTDGNWIEVIRERFDGAFSHIWEDNS